LNDVQYYSRLLSTVQFVKRQPVGRRRPTARGDGDPRAMVDGTAKFEKRRQIKELVLVCEARPKLARHAGARWPRKIARAAAETPVFSAELC
jgi:hypothetical protein